MSAQRSFPNLSTFSVSTVLIVNMYQSHSKLILVFTSCMVASSVALVCVSGCDRIKSFTSVYSNNAQKVSLEKSQNAFSKSSCDICLRTKSVSLIQLLFDDIISQSHIKSGYSSTIEKSSIRDVTHVNPALLLILSA